MKHAAVPALVVLALLALVPEAPAATQLVWQTPQGGVTVGRAQRLTLTTLDLSLYDRVRVVVTSRANTSNLATILPATILLYIGEGNALTLFDTLTLSPDPTRPIGVGLTTPDNTASPWGATRLYNHPVIRTLAVVAVGDTFASSVSAQPMTFDLFIYGETEAR
jgi:hypothetical protein